jgi:hypothetical protein
MSNHVHLVLHVDVLNIIYRDAHRKNFKLITMGDVSVTLKCVR